MFAHELTLPIRTLAEKSYNITHWSEFQHGGHFAAMEGPEELVADIRQFFSDM